MGVKITWMKFADTLVHQKARCFLPDTHKSGASVVDYDVKESKNCDTIVVEVTLRFNFYNYVDGSKTTLKSYHGKSARLLKKKKRQKNEKEEMTNEAKKAALIECFKDRFGFTQFNDIFVDDLHRPKTA